VVLIVWGFTYHQLMTRWLNPKSKEDFRLKTEGRVLDFFEQDDHMFFHVEVELNKIKQIISVPFYDEKDKMAVGNMIYLLVDESNLDHCEIDWEREMSANQSHNIKKAVLIPSYALFFVGLILIFKGIHIF